jgi:hypothetical protein
MDKLEPGGLSISENEWQSTEGRSYPTLNPEQQRHAEEILGHRLSDYEHHPRAEPDALR